MDIKKRVLLVYALKGAGVGIMLALVLFNIVGSQLIPSLYFSFVRDDRTAVIELLRAVKLRPEFASLARIQRDIFGPSLDDELFAEERRRETRIVELEHYLESNPKSRDILYTLSDLYFEKGDTVKGQAYLDQARAIDPQLGR